MKPVRSPKLFYSILLAITFACGVCLLSNPILFHMAYSPIEALFCASRVAKQLNVDPSHSAIINYYETNLRAGMSREEVHKAFSDVAPIAANGDDDFEEIVFRMCSEPLNNVVFYARYDMDGNLISIEEDTFP